MSALAIPVYQTALVDPPWRPAPASPQTPPRRRIAWWVMVIFALSPGLASISGCASPPAVSPLMRVTEQALRAEASALQADGKRDTAMIRRSRESLNDAYDTDLTQRAERAGDLSVEWVREATSVYVEAREQLVRHEQALADERRTRRANLLDAAAAQHRVIELLQRQDQLLTGTLGFDLWQLLETR